MEKKDFLLFVRSSLENLRRGKLLVRARCRNVLIQQEILLQLAGVRVAVVLQIRADGDGVVFRKESANFTERCGPLGVRAEKDVEDPLGLENDGETLGIASAALLVSGSLDDGEEWLAAITQAPFLMVNSLGVFCGPGLLVNLSEAVEEFPKGRIVLFDGAWVFILLGEEDKRCVGAERTGFREVVVQTVSQKSNIAGVGEIIVFNEDIYLIVSLETLGRVYARENEVFVEKNACVVVISRPLPCTLWECGCYLGPIDYEDELKKNGGLGIYLVNGFGLFGRMAGTCSVTDD